MISQGQFMVTSPVLNDRVSDLRVLLSSMNSAPGQVDPMNTRVPFARFENIHFARFVVADDQTLGDRAAFSGLPANERILLIFLADCDGPGDELMARMATEAGQGLREVFSHCDGFDAGTDLLAWMQARQTPPSAFYVNWIGRTVRQVREEAALHDALHRELHGGASGVSRDTAQSLHQHLRAATVGNGTRLTPIEPMTLRQWIGKVGLIVLLALLALVLLIPLIIIAPFFFIALRYHEKTDPVIDTRADSVYVSAIAKGEDHDVTNSFSAIGSLKPGGLRLLITQVALWGVGQTAVLIFNRGRLARVSTIHFARWVLLDGNRRVFFASNYDGSLESYMDDFINKVAFGLNLVFSNGIAYPPTDYLVLRGAWQEQMFKQFLHRHQLKTDVWYKAYPGLTNADLARNARIRQGLESTTLSDGAIRRWLAEI
ncbi:hypothetical protein [Pseudomonas sp. NA-150]|uniref:hypothetical protein n=1 Tax=Pseudomonas sp. NA-150 TaxID=3367525 RepID=UPI0037CB1994